MKTDLLVLGAGASGLMAALAAAGRGLSVIVLEASRNAGRKLAACGGGRANFTNKQLDAGHYLCDGGPQFCMPALSSFGNKTMPELLARWKIPWEERAKGRCFLKAPARTLAIALQRDCEAHGCRFVFGHKAEKIEKSVNGFVVWANGDDFEAASLLLALGSPAAPGLGSTADGFSLAKAFGHRINPPAPALVPLLWQQEEQKKFASLAGIGFSGSIAAHEDDKGEKLVEFADDILFTHKGLSGPAILNASLYWRRNMPLKMDCLPGRNFETMLDAGEKLNKTPRSLLKEHLPQKLVDTILPEILARKRIARISRRDRKLLANCAHEIVFTPKGTAGMRAAEICRGGVATGQVNPQTFESLLRPNLYIVGEMLDVAGQLGGYNLHWAFASGYCAGRAVTNDNKISRL